MVDHDDGEKTIADDNVITKYKTAADIVNSKYLLMNPGLTCPATRPSSFSVLV